MLIMLKSETYRFSHDFLLTLESCGLIPTTDKPTRVYNNCATLIDNVFINTPENVFMSGNIVSDISDHFSQFCILKSTKEKFEVTKLKMRDFSRFSENLFCDELSNINWEEIFRKNPHDVDKIFTSFFKRFNKVVNKHAPLKTISTGQAKRFSKPWITKGIRTAIKTKNKLYASGDLTNYKRYRNKISNLIRLNKVRYYNEFFDANINNIKKPGREQIDS